MSEKELLEILKEITEILKGINETLKLHSRVLGLLLEDSIMSDDNLGIFKAISEDMEDNAFWRFYDKKRN